MSIYSFLSQGTEIQAIEVQVHLRFQIPSFQILGLAGPEIQEARERIIAAFSSSELEFPKKKVIVNLAPSDVKKSGTGHDLAMAVGIIAKTGGLPFKVSKNTKIFAWGSLGLDGKIQPSGKIASLIELLSADPSPKILFLSLEDAESFYAFEEWRKEKKLSYPQNTELKIIHSLREITEESKNPTRILKQNIPLPLPELLPLLPHQERVLDLSIVGRHHTLILGPKGVGKSQMLEWYRWLSPESDPAKTWQRFLYEDTSKTTSLPHAFPLRSVHAQVKPAHLLGHWNARGFRAGELSLAHGGILIADEFLEWHRDAKECLREPLQNKKTTITRVHGTTEIACDFQLIATGNLCPCGGLPLKFRKVKSKLSCQCSPGKVEDYMQRLSGPIADRIDLISIFPQELTASSITMSKIIDEKNILEKKQSLLAQQQFAIREFGAIPSELSVRWLETHLPKDPYFEEKLAERTTSLRSRHKALRIARTIQALDMSSEFKMEHLLEALGYRFTPQDSHRSES